LPGALTYSEMLAAAKTWASNRISASGPRSTEFCAFPVIPASFGRFCLSDPKIYAHVGSNFEITLLYVT
jgi:hypothetical protein